MTSVESYRGVRYKLSATNGDALHPLSSGSLSATLRF